MMASLHDDWREIRAKLNKLTDEQLGKLVHDAVESGMINRWPRLDYKQRSGIRKFLVGLVR